jgi:hypothetical protein
LYDKLADGKDPENPVRRTTFRADVFPFFSSGANASFPVL